MENPFSWDYLTAPLREVPTFGPFSLAFVTLFGLTFIVSAFLYATANKRFATNPVLRRGVRNATQIMMWLTGIGLFFFAWRAARIDFATLYMRIWSYFFLLLYIGAIGYFIYWFRTTYQQKMQAVERERIRRAYSPTPRRSGRKKARRGAR